MSSPKRIVKYTQDQVFQMLARQSGLFGKLVVSCDMKGDGFTMQVETADEGTPKPMPPRVAGDYVPVLNRKKGW